MRRKRMMEALEENIRDHIERETQDNIERGVSPEEARSAARSKFGNVAQVKELTRDVWSFICQRDARISGGGHPCSCCA